MALGMANSGKYLSKKWHDRREKYKDDPEGFSDEEKLWLESSTIQGAGDTKLESWLVENQPIDASYYESKGAQLVDIREVKEVLNRKEEK